jgi:integrase/recombinase XerD
MPQLEDILTGQLSASSIAMYKRDMHAYVSYTEEYNIVWLDPKSLVAWRDDLALQTIMSPNTINRMLSSVRRVIKEMADRDLIEESISMKFDRVRGVKVKSLKKRLKKNSRTLITKDDMRRLCESPDTDTVIGIRDAALLAVLASSGVRASEAATLTFSQIRTHENGYSLDVCGKADIEYRSTHLSKEAYDLIYEWKGRRPFSSETIFTSFDTRAAIPRDRPMSESSVWRVVQKYAGQCAIPHIKPHDFRRFVGTQILTKTGDIRKAQKALGHQSIETTARHYVLDTLEIGLTDNLY